MFKQASCYFRSGSDWEADPVTFRPGFDHESQAARFVTVPLGDRTASMIKCRFHFGDLWMLFSEVAFQSGKVIMEWAAGLPSGRPLKARLSYRINSLQHLSRSPHARTPQKHAPRSADPFMTFFYKQLKVN